MKELEDAGCSGGHVRFSLRADNAARWAQLARCVLCRAPGKICIPAADDGTQNKTESQANGVFFMTDPGHVFGIFEAPQAAEAAVDELLTTDFGAWTITVMFRDNEDSRDFARRKNTRVPLGTDHGKTADQPLDGSWGFLYPGAGPSEGALPGALAEMGVPAEWSDGSVVDGNVLVSVECANPERVRQATEVFRVTGAKDTGFSAIPAPEFVSSASGV